MVRVNREDLGKIGTLLIRYITGRGSVHLPHKLVLAVDGCSQAIGQLEELCPTKITS